MKNRPGGGEGAFPPSSNRSRGTCQETQALSLYTVAHSFAPTKNQLFCFQAIPHSFARTPRGGDRKASCRERVEKLDGVVTVKKNTRSNSRNRMSQIK